MPPPDESIFQPKEPRAPRRSGLFSVLLIITSAILFLAFLLYVWIFIYLNSPSKDFPVNTSITLAEGSSAKTIAADLAANGVVRSELALYLTLIRWHDPSTIKASTYVFDQPLTTRQIAEEITRGNFNHDLVRLTHIEGERATHLATRAAAILADFDEAEFLAMAIPAEGKLFPETYFIPEEFTADDLYTLLTDTFYETTAPLQEEIEQSNLSLDDILILASIIEREANTDESMRLVSGILQNRLAIGIALQVDASMEYVLDKPLSELTPEDLKRDTPYNTYLYPGLPPTPIGNPGLSAIMAVLEPINSDYMFYITGSDGEFYYAETFDGHRQNIARYLR
jgi:UPF0755 protein